MISYSSKDTPYIVCGRAAETQSKWRYSLRGEDKGTSRVWRNEVWRESADGDVCVCERWWCGRSWEERTALNVGEKRRERTHSNQPQRHKRLTPNTSLLHAKGEEKEGKRIVQRKEREEVEEKRTQERHTNNKHTEEGVLREERPAHRPSTSPPTQTSLLTFESIFSTFYFCSRPHYQKVWDSTNFQNTTFVFSLSLSSNPLFSKYYFSLIIIIINLHSLEEFSNLRRFQQLTTPLAFSFFWPKIKNRRDLKFFGLHTPSRIFSHRWYTSDSLFLICPKFSKNLLYSSKSKIEKCRWENRTCRTIKQNKFHNNHILISGEWRCKSSGSFGIFTHSLNISMSSWFDILSNRSGFSCSLFVVVEVVCCDSFSFFTACIFWFDFVCLLSSNFSSSKSSS